MTEYLDNIFTDDDLTSQEFTDNINEEQDTEKAEESVDPLLEVIQKEKVEVIEVIRTIVDDLSNEEKIKILRKPRNIASIAVDETGDIVCKSWGNYYISGNKNNVDTAELINEYLKENAVGYNNRIKSNELMKIFDINYVSEVFHQSYKYFFVLPYYNT